MKKRKKDAFEARIEEVLEELTARGLISFELDEQGEKCYYATPAGKQVNDLIQQGISPKN